MYCPRCGHEQASEARHFCSKCGLSLDGISDLIETSDARFRREKREVLGMGLVIGTVMALLAYYVVMGIIALSRGPDDDILSVFVIGLSISLLIGGVGFFNLISSGFFHKLKERRIKLRLESLKQRERELEARMKNKVIEEKPVLQTPETSKMPGTPSVTEATTRNLEADYRTPARIRDSQ